MCHYWPRPHWGWKEGAKGGTVWEIEDMVASRCLGVPQKGWQRAESKLPIQRRSEFLCLPSLPLSNEAEVLEGESVLCQILVSATVAAPLRLHLKWGHGTDWVLTPRLLRCLSDGRGPAPHPRLRYAHRGSSPAWWWALVTGQTPCPPGDSRIRAPIAIPAGDLSGPLGPSEWF